MEQCAGMRLVLLHVTGCRSRQRYQYTVLSLFNVSRLCAMLKAPCIARALYEYQSQASTELPLKEGETVEIIRKDESGWWEGRSCATGEVGYFPGNFVEEVAAASAAPPTTQDAIVPGGSPSPPASVKTQKKYQSAATKPAKSQFEEEFVSSPTRFGLWATNMGLGSGVVVAVVSIAEIAACVGDKPNFDVEGTELLLSIYGLLIGIATFVVEKRWILRTNSMVPIRAVTYTLVAVPLMYTQLIQMAAVSYFFVAAANLASALLGEQFLQEGGSPKAGPALPQASLKYRFQGALRRLQEQNGMGTIIFVILFVASNVLIGTSGFIIWYNNVLGMQQTPYALTMFVPFAKMFGYMLDFNCAIILIPVCRTFIRYLYDLSTQSQTATQKLLRTVLQVFPLDKALTFHKRVAYLILIFAVGHAFFHCLNYGFAVQNTMALFGIWPWASGTTIFVIMALMYGAAMPNVKHFQFELFWNTHHLFVLFFVLLVAHGRTGLNPNYWKWLIVPMTIYIAERIYRHRSAYRSVTLTSVNNMGKVLCITFERDGAFPDGYKEGQYLFLNCPHVSIGQWHPFTISSAPQEADVSVHMRVMGPSSWTGKVTEYLKLMIPPNASYAKFTNARSKGKVIGPDGQQIFCIYGPHSAPTQHIAEYTVDMIIGAGIGVTPVSATLRSIVHHRWKFSIGTTFPEHAYFCWIVSHSELDSFRWFIRVMKDADDAIHNALLKDTSMKSKTFEIHVYVTSTPRHFTYAVPAITDDIAFWGAHLSASPDAVEKKAAPWTESQMLLALKCPSDRPTRLGNVLVYNGRPQWDTRFEEVYSRHVGQNIGVAFCGNPRIGKDLKKACESHSNTITNTYFKLHRENF